MMCTCLLRDKLCLEGGITNGSCEGGQIISKLKETSPSASWYRAPTDTPHFYHS
jgi:hypothetical protein